MLFSHHRFLTFLALVGRRIRMLRVIKLAVWNWFRRCTNRIWLFYRCDVTHGHPECWQSLETLSTNRQTSEWLYGVPLSTKMPRHNVLWHSFLKHANSMSTFIFGKAWHHVYRVYTSIKIFLTAVMVHRICSVTRAALSRHSVYVHGNLCVQCTVCTCKFRIFTGKLGNMLQHMLADYYVAGVHASIILYNFF